MTRVGYPLALFRREGTPGQPLFVDVAADVGLLVTLDTNGALLVDVDRDGDLDLVLSFIGPGGHRLYRNVGSATEPMFELASDSGLLAEGVGESGFDEGTRAAGVGLDETGMGSTLGDIDADGDLDWFVSAVYSPPFLSGNRLYVQGTGSHARRFVDESARYDVADAGWGWGAAFVDLDHDGQLDLVVANGASRGPVTPQGCALVQPGQRGAGAWSLLVWLLALAPGATRRLRRRALRRRHP